MDATNAPPNEGAAPEPNAKPAPSRRWFQFGVGTLLLFVTLVAVAAWRLTSDRFFLVESRRFMRAAHAYDAGDGYVVAENALVFIGRHQWFEGYRKTFCVVFGQAGAGVHRLPSDAQIELIETAPGPAKLVRRAGRSWIETTLEGERYEIPLAGGGVIEGADHEHWRQLLSDPTALESADRMRPPSPAEINSFLTDSSATMWSIAELKRWLDDN